MLDRLLSVRPTRVLAGPTRISGVLAPADAYRIVCSCMRLATWSGGHNCHPRPQPRPHDAHAPPPYSAAAAYLRRGAVISVVIPAAAHAKDWKCCCGSPQSPVSGSAAEWADFGRYAQPENLNRVHKCSPPVAKKRLRLIGHLLAYLIDKSGFFARIAPDLLAHLQCQAALGRYTPPV